jgi:hypothetical protein
VISLTKNIARLALVGAAAAAFALPATPASACAGTFVQQCVENLVGTPAPICLDPSTIAPICVP